MRSVDSVLKVLQNDSTMALSEQFVLREAGTDKSGASANSFNPDTVQNLMCRGTLNVGWRGEVYDCDFNQMLDLQLRDAKPLFLWDLKPADLTNRSILTGIHCLACTAGNGSSCSGAVVQ